jgi:hypothetical protein
MRDLVGVRLRYCAVEHLLSRIRRHLLERLLCTQALDHALVRILIGEFAQIERAGACDVDAGAEGVRILLEAAHHFLRGFQRPAAARSG